MGSIGLARRSRIYRQKPDLFWSYKKLVYENQGKLSAFTFDEFASGFAKDHDLDMEKYGADVASESIRNELLRAVGVAFANDIRATPSYLVNGVIVEPGEDGKHLASYVDAVMAADRPHGQAVILPHRDITGIDTGIHLNHAAAPGQPRRFCYRSESSCGTNAQKQTFAGSLAWLRLVRAPLRDEAEWTKLFGGRAA